MSNHQEKIYALFGHPVMGNPTEEMILDAFLDKGWKNYRYISVDLETKNLEDAIVGMRTMQFYGAHITKPFKVDVIQYVDQLSESAALIGAVNLISRKEDQLLGENTDGKGFLESLTAKTDPTGKKVILLGAGGAARAIGVELALAGVRQITVVNRNMERGHSLTGTIRKCKVDVQYQPWLNNYLIPQDADIVINATSIGMNDPDQMVPVDFSEIQKGAIVADVVINPPKTRFLQTADDNGCITINGLGMLVNQGVIGFSIWTGEEPNRMVMEHAIRRELGIDSIEI